MPGWEGYRRILVEITAHGWDDIRQRNESGRNFEVVQTIVFIAGLSGLGLWLRKWIVALKGAVDAQRPTIDAQKVFIESMATLLNAADAPKMIERYEAYKKIVDHEKDAQLAQYEQQLQEQRTVNITTVSGSIITSRVNTHL